MPTSPSQPSKRPQSSPARIGALATLPVFFDLKNKPVLLIGGTEAATWKAELIAATGANVAVHAAEFCNEMQMLSARNDLVGSIKLVEQPWSARAMANMSLVIGDAQTEGEAKAIFCAARAQGVPVNIIDKPSYCTFKFGTIVNRSPVVIGISTDGAAPVLGQAIRTRIEALLPASLAQWAQLAKDIRGIVLHRFAAGTERRQFWARFARLAFGPFAEGEPWRISEESRSNAAGFITVLTAPRADPGLLTLNDVRALQGSDAIYFDAQVDPVILDHARREASRHELAGRALSSHLIAEAADCIHASVKRGENVLVVCEHGKSQKTASVQLVALLSHLGVQLRNCEGNQVKGNHFGSDHSYTRKSVISSRESMNA